MKEELIEAELDRTGTGQQTCDKVREVLLNGICRWTDKRRNQSV